VLSHALCIKSVLGYNISGWKKLRNFIWGRGWTFFPDPVPFNAPKLITTPRLRVPSPPPAARILATPMLAIHIIL